MADRYQNRPYATDDSRTPRSEESDPLAELARLIGQTDPFAMGRANLKVQPQPAQRHSVVSDYDLPPEPNEAPPAPPAWMQRATRHEPPPPPVENYQPSNVHPLHRYAATHHEPEPEPEYDPPQAYADSSYEPDPSRYDDALYGAVDSGERHHQHDQAYADDTYYENEYSHEPAEEPKRRRGMLTVFALLALAVFGVGGAFAYRNFTGSARSGEPPIIRADAGPTKIIPAASDSSIKVPDRMSVGDGTEKIVPREEAPVDVNAQASGPRVVFPPLNQNGSPPPVASVAPGTMPPAGSGNGTLANNEPRKIKTLSVRGDQSDAGVPAGAVPPPAAPAKSPARPSASAQRTALVANANAAGGSSPLSLAPEGAAAPAVAEPPVRVAATNPTQQVAPASSASGGGYLVQISSQRSEADAQASFRALQGKFPSVLGSHNPVIKRADLGEKGVYYRAMVGPFNSPDEASQFCGNLKSAGGQCVVQRN